MGGGVFEKAQLKWPTSKYAELHYSHLQANVIVYGSQVSDHGRNLYFTPRALIERLCSLFYFTVPSACLSFISVYSPARQAVGR